MSFLRIGRNRNLKLNKYLVFDIFAFVFTDYTAIQVLLKLGKQGAQIVLRNRDLLNEIFSSAKQKSAMNFKLNDKLTLDMIDVDHFDMTGLM